MWALGACTCEAVGGIYPTVETVRLDRNVTCNFGPLRQVGWSVDVCDGRFNVSLVKEEVRTYHFHLLLPCIFIIASGFQRR